MAQTSLESSQTSLPLPLLSVQNVCFAYPHRSPVLNSVNLKLERGQVCTILGSNGAGKTTLLNCIGGYFIPTSGTVVIDGTNILSMPGAVRAQRIGFVAQMQVGGSDLEVRDYLALGHAMRISLFSVPTEQQYARVEAVMKDFGISNLAGRSLAELSGGERQQVEIARVLVQDTDLILMDEPTNHLDYANQVKVLSMIVHLSRDMGKTILLTSHMPDQALLLDGAVALLDHAGHLTSGSVTDMLTEQRLREIYQADIRIVYVPELQRNVCTVARIK